MNNHKITDDHRRGQVTEAMRIYARDINAQLRRELEQHERRAAAELERPAPRRKSSATSSEIS